MVLRPIEWSEQVDSLIEARDTAILTALLGSSVHYQIVSQCETPAVSRKVELLVVHSVARLVVSGSSTRMLDSRAPTRCCEFHPSPRTDQDLLFCGWMQSASLKQEAMRHPVETKEDRRFRVHAVALET